MARRPGTTKAETHDRIVRTAAGALRRHGYDGTRVAEVMDEAGLTHGGFYAHFASREAMLTEALDAAAAESLDRLGKSTDGVPAADKLTALVDAYLSDRHVAQPERGCTLAALGSETVRQSAEIRQVMTRRARELADLIERQMVGWGKAGRHDDALGAMCAMVGALTIARAVDDPKLGKDLRAAARKLIARGTTTPA